MAIDTAQKRAMAINASIEWSDVTIPLPDGEIDKLDKVHLLSGYFLFKEYEWGGRHEVAMRKLFPVKVLTESE